MFVFIRLLSVESIQAASATASTIMGPVRAARNDESAGPRLANPVSDPEPASISDDTIQMDHNAVVLFTIDRLARSPRATVRRRSTRKAPDRWFIKQICLSGALVVGRAR